LALGDFTYMQNFFRAFKERYPKIKIDLWVDEARGKSFFRRWNSKPSKYVLYDWLESTLYFNKIYKNTNSWWQLKRFLKEAKGENYPIVVSLAILRSHRFASFARIICPQGSVFGLFAFCKKYQLVKKYYYLKKINKAVIFNEPSQKPVFHVSEFYANIFEQFFGLQVGLEKHLPFINFPKKWGYFGKLKFLKWGINRKDREGQKTIFINAFAKNKKRCWPIENVFELVSDLQKDDLFYDARFIVNVLPYGFRYCEKSLKNFSSKQIFLFTADYNFFQLPAVIKLCDFVITVDTSIVHLSAALQIPVIVLMRKKSLEWVPYGTKYDTLTTMRRSDFIKSIQVYDVLEKIKSFVRS
jgi:heptosyltransferase III